MISINLISLQYLLISMSFFSSFGGFPFGGLNGGNDSSEDRQEVDNTAFYKALGISKDAGQEQIKKSYRELAKKYHPDRPTGDANKFKQISQAYETLSDPEKRRIYDKYGPKGPQAGGDDLLNMFFGGGGRGREGPSQKSKCKPTKLPLEVTLQQCYNGQLLKIPHERQRACQTCNGKGGSGVQTCKQCKGKGRVTQMYQMGPGMYQQVQKACDVCRGQGEIVQEGKKCKTCLGKKIQKKKKIVEVPLQTGSYHGHPITLYGQGQQIPDTLAGDLIFVVQEKPHEIFTRKGTDLFMKKKITLVQALIGFEFQIKHLDGQSYNIYTARGEILADKQKKTVRGLGMPHFKSQSQFVVMPKKGELTNQQLEALSGLLPGKINQRPKGEYDMMEDFDKQGVNTSEEGGHKNVQEQEEYQQQGGCHAQ